MKAFLSALCIFVLAITGCCKTEPVKITSHQFWPENHRREIGVALAGGGTKASSFAMGVLSALSHKDMLWKTDAISTVSGGSYAGFFLYSRLIADHRAKVMSEEKTKAYFQDCITYEYHNRNSYKDGTLNFTKDQFAKIADDFCKNPPGANFAEDFCKENTDEIDCYLHQQYVECGQDILETSCNFSRTGADVSEYFNIGRLLGVSLLTAPFSLVANTVFDWPVNLSPSRQGYEDGIGRTYGLYPTTFDALEKEKEKYCINSFQNCELINGIPLLSRNLRPKFSDLRSLYENNSNRPPVWMINATAAPSRSIFGWLNRNDTDINLYSFRMSPFLQASNAYGAVDLEHENIDVLDAVTASAAFLDANQRVKGAPLVRFGLGIFQHFFNLNWGIDIPHPDVCETRRVLRSLLPFPVYYIDYVVNGNPAYIRLVDGGSSDDLGAYSLISDKYKDVIISDHAEDVDGTMADLCLLRNELLARHNWYLHMPGLQDWPKPCAAQRKRSMEENRVVANLFPELDEQELKKLYYYPVHAWPYPFLAGCVSTSGDPGKCEAPDKIISRLWLIKPAIDYPFFLANQRQDGNSKTISECGGEKYLPCETSKFLINNIGNLNSHNVPIFPQNRTVFMTIDSSHTLYKAYRELARAYTEAAIDAIKTTQKDALFFTKLIQRQGKYPIQAAIHDKSKLRFDYAISDIEMPGWTLKKRDQARNCIHDGLCGE
jgi:hypothetical protein